MDGQTVLIRARVQTSRAQGNKMVFLNLRQRIDSVQALLTVTPEKVSKQMVKWTAGLQDESIVLVEGIVKKSPEIIKSATVGDVELHVFKASHLRSMSESNKLIQRSIYCRRSTSFLVLRAACRSL